MKNELLDSISKMIPTGNRLELPIDEIFANYAAVKKCLIDAGGKYKRCGFEFSDDASEVQERLLGGEAINDKKKYQFFATPPELARRLVDMVDIQKHHFCLEPSAGQGAISDIMLEKSSNCIVIELMQENINALIRKKYNPIKCDFLNLGAEFLKGLGTFDRIVANPPFTKNQDVDHILHMLSMLAPGGKLVSLASKSWMTGNG
jgi:hypothetical protein